MTFIAAVAAIARAIHALADFFAKFISIKKENHTREINARAHGFKKLRTSINARSEVRQTLDKNVSAGNSNPDNSMPDDGFRRD